MGTSAPAIRTHDIPLTEPYTPPRQLPTPDPARIAPVIVPVKQPDRVPVRRA